MPEDTAFNIIYKTKHRRPALRGVSRRFFKGIRRVIDRLNHCFFSVAFVPVQFRQESCQNLQLAICYKSVTLMTSYYKLYQGGTFYEIT